MPLALVTAPTAEPVSLTDVKAHLRVDGSDDDTLITAYIVAARQAVEGALNRALVTQTWDLTLDAFPGSAAKETIYLPRGAVSVSSVKYTDSDGTLQTLASDQYQVAIAGLSARILPAYGLTWPVTRVQANAVNVRFTAGFGAAADVPGAIKAAIMLTVGDLYRDRETTAIGAAVNLLPAASALLAPYQVLAV